MSRLLTFAKPYRVDGTRVFRLKDIDPGDAGGLGPDFKDEAREHLAEGVRRLSELQDKLYAQDRWAVLLIFQAMDAAGKDSAIKHVMSGVNPQGVQVFSFKAPTPQELDHDFMWRHLCCLPERGRIGIFNRSYYEEVLIVRLRRAILESQKLPHSLTTKRIWAERFQDIRNAERYLSRNGTLILKFFLHVSKKEQKTRLLERLDRPDKNWKFNIDDLEARQPWRRFMALYEDAIRETATEHAPWFVVPADKKWFTRLVVVDAVIKALESLDLKYPQIDRHQRLMLEQGRKALERD